MEHPTGNPARRTSSPAVGGRDGRAGRQAAEGGGDNVTCCRGKARRAIGTELDAQAEAGQGLVGGGQAFPALAGPGGKSPAQRAAQCTRLA